MISKLLIQVCLYENDDVKNIKPQIPVFFFYCFQFRYVPRMMLWKILFSRFTHTQKKKSYRVVLGRPKWNVTTKFLRLYQLSSLKKKNAERESRSNNQTVV